MPLRVLERRVFLRHVTDGRVPMLQKDKLIAPMPESLPAGLVRPDKRLSLRRNLIQASAGLHLFLADEQKPVSNPPWLR